MANHGEEALISLERMAVTIGPRIDYVQGGGGNISAKLDDKRMAIKASGFRISQVDRHSGHVVVDYGKLRRRYTHVSAGVPQEKAEPSREQSGALRPSVEVDFHSLLKKYVIHTHSVYANIVGCSRNGSELFRAIFHNADFSFACLDYCDPGSALAQQMYALQQAEGLVPCVYLLKNHGLVVTSDNLDECLSRHEEINDRIRAFFAPLDPFPEVRLEKQEDGAFCSATPYVSALRNAGLRIPDTLSRYPLYPDQLVYLNMSLLNGEMSVPSDARIRYDMTRPAALNAEETLAGYLYIVHTMRGKKLDITSLNSPQVDFIMNWEGEKYRRKLSQ